MILIESIKWYEVEGDVREMMMMNRPTDPLWLASKGEEIVPVEQEIVKDIIRGRRFRRPRDGTDVCIGIASDPSDLLGLQYEAWDNMESEWNRQRGLTNMVERDRRQLLGANLWTRIKWVFTGVKL